MLRLNISLRLILALAMLCVLPARADMLTTGAGGTKAPAASYTGPGDVVSSAIAWWGLRAYSAADRGNRLINLCDASGANCTDVSSNASTGALNAPTNIGGTDCTAVNTCQVKILYDRSGANSCTGAVACDASQATAASRPTFKWNCVGTTPCLQGSGSQTLVVSVGLTSTTAQPFTVSLVVDRTGNTSAQGFAFGTSGGGGVGVGFGAANTLRVYASSNSDLSSINDNTFHAWQMIANGASSTYYVDGTGHTQSPGTTGLSTTPNIFDDAFSNFLTGNLCEVGLWASGFNSTQQSNMNSNQHSYWGF